MLIDLHNSCLIAAPVAREVRNVSTRPFQAYSAPVTVVWRREDRHHVPGAQVLQQQVHFNSSSSDRNVLPVVTPVVALHNQLVRPCNQLEAIGVVKPASATAASQSHDCNISGSVVRSRSVKLIASPATALRCPVQKL